jgi:N-acetylmuramoyl-L-alanine amidase
MERKYWQGYKELAMRYLVCILILLWPLAVLANEPVNITGMRILPSATKTVMIFNLSASTPGSVKFLSKTNQLVLTFTNAKLRYSVHKARLGGANVTEFTAEELPNNRVEWTLQTNGKVTWKTDLTQDVHSSRAELKLEVNSANFKQEVLPAQPVKPVLPVKPAFAPEKISQKVKAHIFTVVIDAGHGGKDSGAVGKNSIREKDVVLSIAIKMAAKLEKMQGVRVVMTRKGDYFVPLRTRLNIARKASADLFIAVHADAYFNNDAIGASVYALSQHGATNEASRWLAKQANYSEIDGIDLDHLSDHSRMVRSVLIDLSQTATIRDSLRLGNKVLDAVERVTPLHYRKVEQAPFVVLKSPDIPSILIETGFISNPHEAEQLSNSAYQNTLADALCSGVKTYIRKYGPLLAQH